MAQQKTVKQCRDEWKVAKTTGMITNGKTQRAYVAECRGVPLIASATGADKKPPAEALPGKQFATEAEAKSDCAADAVVWVNLRSGVYHDRASKSYGATKSGAYMCERESIAEGFHASKAPKRTGGGSTDPAKDGAKPASG
jgi:hypothetical protein